MPMRASRSSGSRTGAAGKGIGPAAVGKISAPAAPARGAAQPASANAPAPAKPARKRRRSIPVMRHPLGKSPSAYTTRL